MRIAKELTNNYIVGQIDGDGNFDINFKAPEVYSHLAVKLTQKYGSADLLCAIKLKLKCGNIYIDNRKDKTLSWTCGNINDILNIIIPFFDSNKQRTSKELNYLDWKEVANIQAQGLHRTEEGIKRIKEQKKRMNKARTYENKRDHVNITSKQPQEAEWIQGFTDAEGSFGFSETKASAAVKFSIGQNSHDRAIQEAIKNFFNIGSVYPQNLKPTNKKRKFFEFYPSLAKDILIPFFDKYPMHTTKHWDYLDWKEGINIIMRRPQSEKDRNQLSSIINNMNRKREKLQNSRSQIDIKRQ